MLELLMFAVTDPQELRQEERFAIVAQNDHPPVDAGQPQGGTDRAGTR